MIAIKAMALATLVAAATLSTQAPRAQQPPGIGRTEVQRSDLSTPGREVVQVRVDFAPGASFGRHAHPGEEVAYVLEGTLEYRFDDKPPVTLKAGDALFIPSGTVHSAHNVGSGKASELATYILRKGEPALTLAR